MNNNDRKSEISSESYNEKEKGVIAAFEKAE